MTRALTLTMGSLCDVWHFSGKSSKDFCFCRVIDDYVVTDNGNDDYGDHRGLILNEWMKSEHFECHSVFTCTCLGDMWSTEREIDYFPILVRSMAALIGHSFQRGSLMRLWLFPWWHPEPSSLRKGCDKLPYSQHAKTCLAQKRANGKADNRSLASESLRNPQ